MFFETQSTNGLQRVKKLYPRTALQDESNGVTKNVKGKSSPVGNQTSNEAVSVIALCANEPSKRRRLIGEMEAVGMSLFSTKFESIKQSVEPESSKQRNFSKAEVSANCSVSGNSVVRKKRKELSERVDALRTTSPLSVRTWSTQLLLCTWVQELRTNFPELRQQPIVQIQVLGQWQPWLNYHCCSAFADHSFPKYVFRHRMCRVRLSSSFPTLQASAYRPGRDICRRAWVLGIPSWPS